MLKLLTENEAAIRRSGNPRLVIETLLLRWTMLDRTVDLQQVLAGAPIPSGGPSAPSDPSPARRPAGPPPPRPATGPPPASSRGADGAEPVLSTPMAGPVAPTSVAAQVPALRDAWSGIVAEVRAGSRFLGEALGATAPSAVEGEWLTVTLAEPNPLFAERLQAQAQTVEEALRRATGQPLRLRVTEATGANGEAAPRPRRLTDESLKADRLRIFRAKDATLDTAADALDLEIVD
jgi:DNA polymerase-3 subunit gamma/tau